MTATFAFPAAATHSRTRSGTGALRARGAVHRGALALVWLTFALSGLVFAEPAPVDLMLIGLVVLLPLIGLAAITPEIMGFVALWLVVAAGGFLASPFAADAARATLHTAVTLYLSLAAAVIAAFVIREPVAHTRLVLNATTWAAVAATLAGLAGYFSLLPAAADLFTRFGRAAGTFKDPNVFGAFLVLPVIYCLERVVALPLRRALWPLVGATLMTLGVLLSFSRGAWINLALAAATFGFLTFSLAAGAAERARIALMAGAAAAIVAVATVTAVQIETVSDLLAERATLSQSYDTGPEGRFGGQEKALRLVAENPLGIGALEFTQSHHHEEVHNVYLSMALNAGWIGGGLFVVAHALTVVLGATALIAAGPLRPLLVVALSTFLATALEGIVIDTDHWRHLYLEMALVWGLAIAARAPSARAGGHALRTEGRPA